jgi:hypothetical protein
MKTIKDLFNWVLSGFAACSKADECGRYWPDICEKKEQDPAADPLASTKSGESRGQPGRQRTVRAPG